ncbi:792_t:CDS:2, partial [Racocetra fulgida]
EHRYRMSSSSNAIISTIKEYIDQTMSAHMDLINKINKRIEASLNQQKQKDRPNNNNDFGQQGNCPLTPILNNLLININDPSQQNGKDTMSITKSHVNKAIKIRSMTQ